MRRFHPFATHNGFDPNNAQLARMIGIDSMRRGLAVDVFLVGCGFCRPVVFPHPAGFTRSRVIRAVGLRPAAIAGG
jgi:hypothetical protein